MNYGKKIIDFWNIFKKKLKHICLQKMHYKKLLIFRFFKYYTYMLMSMKESNSLMSQGQEQEINESNGVEMV